MPVTTTAVCLGVVEEEEEEVNINDDGRKERNRKSRRALTISKRRKLTITTLSDRNDEHNTERRDGETCRNSCRYMKAIGNCTVLKEQK